MKQVLKLGIVIQITMLVGQSAYAIDTGSRKTTLDLRLKQGFSAAYDIPGQTTNGPANYVMEIKGSYRPSRAFTFIGDIWLRGDWAPSLDHIRDPDGIPDVSTANFAGNLPYTLNTKESQCLGNATEPNCSDSNEIRSFNDLDEIIREASVKYRDKKNRFTVKLGKFQRGWGQSDGLRLMDILHAQDLRERFAFRDSDELRIPSWMVSMDFNLKKMGMAKAFESMGMKRPVFEFNFVPEVQHSKFVINNPTDGVSRTSGGLFGLPFPTLIDDRSGRHLLGIGATLTDVEAKKYSFSDAEYSARLKFDTLGGQATINAFYGMQDLPLVKLTGATARASFFHNGAVGATFDLAGALGPIGGYLAQLRAGSTDPVGAITGGGLHTVNALFDLDYDNRQQVLGFSFARDMQKWKFGPKQTSPAMRFEFSYEFDKPFNRSTVFSDATNQIESGAAALVVSPKHAITSSDVMSTMLGFDYPLWIPGWDSQEKSIFTSFQIFNIHTSNADEGLLIQAPYLAKVDKNQQFSTFLWSAPLHQQRLVMEGLYIRDFNSSGNFYRQRVDFNYFGKHWRPRLEWMHFSGGNSEQNAAPIGILETSDIIEMSLTYQF